MRLTQFASSIAAVALSAVTYAAAPTRASAQLFDTGRGSFTTYRGANADGVGQGIAVTTTTQLSSFGFYVGAAAGTTLNYFVFNGANNTLLYSQKQTYATGLAQGTLALTDPFALTLNAGQTYYFGVTGNDNYNVSFFFPGVADSQNGLTVAGTNVNYAGFDPPSLDAGIPGAATIGVQLNGTQGMTTTPEPGTWALLGTGLLAVGGMARRRRPQA